MQSLQSSKLTPNGWPTASDFPAINQMVNAHRLAYLDNAATTQKPQAVLDRLDRFYRTENANVHRGVHELSVRATAAFDAVREDLANLIGAHSSRSLIWTKGCTEAINLVATSWGETNLRPGDEILLSSLEHHANIVPWQRVAAKTGAKVKPIPINDEGEVLLDEFQKLLNPSVKLVGIKQICNALGSVQPLFEIANMAKSVGAAVLVDGAQGLAHRPVDVAALNIDFYTMSAHKAYGPTGTGALYVRESILEAMPPYQSGGDMIRTVSWEETTYNDLPNRFEPGTPNMAGVIGFGAAIQCLRAWGYAAIREHEDRLLKLGHELLSSVPGLRLIGTAKEKAAILSFVLEGVHPHDLGTILDSRGVAIRAGHHCCMPLMKRLGVPGTARASLAIYNTEEDIHQLVKGLHEARRIFC